MSRSLSVFGKADSNLLAERGQPDYTGVSLHTSAQSIPIALHWGTRRLSPQIIWQSMRDMSLDKSTTIVENINGTRPYQGQTSPNTGPPWTALDIFSTGGFWGALSLNGTPTATPSDGPTSVHYWVPTILALCEGAISDPSIGSPSMRIWRGGGTAPVLWADIDTGENPDTQWFLEAILGTSTQALWSYWTSGGAGVPAGQALAYRFTAYLASVFLNTGNNNVIPQWSFEITRVPTSTYGAPDSYNLGTDYTPGGIIRDLLLNPQYGVASTPGVGLMNADIDSTSEIQYDTYTRAQGIYLSPLLTSQTPVVDIINRIAVESNAWIFWSGTAIMYAPLGDESVTNVVNSVTYTFTPDLTPAYDLHTDGNDFLSQIVVNRADPIDCFNRVRLEFCDRFNDYAKNPIEWKDSTLINQYGILDAGNIDGQDCCDIVVAAKIVELAGKRMAYIRNHYSFTLSMRYILLLPGTIVTLTDPNLGLDHVPVRVISIDENEKGELAIVAEEYPGTLGLSRPVANQVWSNTGTGVTPTGGSPGGPASGPPTSTSGGALVQTNTQTLVLFVAGDVITLPANMVVGQEYVYLHDERRSPQPTPAILEDNPVTFQRPSGATYNIEDPSDGTLVSSGASTPPNSVKVRGPDGLRLTLINTGDGIVRAR